LIVDDELGLVQLFKSLVERLGYETLTASTGMAALDILDRETPDLMILDLAMPTISGIEVLQHVRSLPRHDSMKVMVVTARPNMVTEAERLGIDCWASKPILPREFLTAVGELLDAH